MDYNKVQNTQPVQSQGRVAETSPYSAPTGGKPAPSSTGKRFAVLATVLVVVVALLAGGLYLASQSQGEGSEASSGAVEKDSYQAVFMTNGQVYFGHFSNIKGVYAELTDVYYLQVQQPVQPADNKNTDPTDQSQVSLTKLGNELHGPKDRMHISRDQILFWENLKDDSTVVKAIKEYKAKQN